MEARLSSPSLSTVDPLREATQAATKGYDVIIIGGGIYGLMMALEACRRKLIVLLLERGQPGNATSANWLRILHGGLRYLQTMDLRRFRDSVLERRWFLQKFPDLAIPLPCLMPLYGQGLKRPQVLRPVLRLNDLLSWRRNQGVVNRLALPRGWVVSPQDVRRLFPRVNTRHLTGGAIWYDALITQPEDMIHRLVLWIRQMGATVLTDIQVEELLNAAGQVVGVSAMQRQNGVQLEYHATTVINATGPWTRHLAARFDRDYPELIIPSLAWNVHLDLPALSDHAVAVTTPGPEGRVFFLVPWKGRIMAGTGHAPWEGGVDGAAPSQAQLTHFLDELNRAIPTLNARPSNIRRVLAGLLPAKQAGGVELTSRPVLIDHGRCGGPQGLYSVSGVKFTTSRRVAEDTIRSIFPAWKPWRKKPVHQPPAA